MSLNPNYKQEYYELLKNTVILVAESDEYEEACKRYAELRAELAALLDEADALTNDAERYIDKSTGELRSHIDFDPSPALLAMLLDFASLYRKKRAFAEKHGWDDGLLNSVEVVIAIAKYEEMERAIIAELGRDAGEAVIYGVKRSILPLEREYGGRIFAGAVERMAQRFRIRSLHALRGNIPLDREDNLDQKELTLESGWGERMACRKWAQLTHRGVTYFELEMLAELKIVTINYYRLDLTDEGQVLTLVEDKELEKELDSVRDRVEVEAAQKARKKQHGSA